MLRKDPPRRTLCGVQDDGVRGMLNMFVGVPALEGEILPAVGRRKRTACGRQDDTRRSDRIALKGLNQVQQQYSLRLWQTQANTLRVQDNAERELLHR